MSCKASQGKSIAHASGHAVHAGLCLAPAQLKRCCSPAHRGKLVSSPGPPLPSLPAAQPAAPPAAAAPQRPVSPKQPRSVCSGTLGTGPQRPPPQAGLPGVCWPLQPVSRGGEAGHEGHLSSTFTPDRRPTPLVHAPVQIRGAHKPPNTLPRLPWKPHKRLVGPSSQQPGSHEQRGGPPARRAWPHGRPPRSLSRPASEPVHPGSVRQRAAAPRTAKPRLRCMPPAPTARPGMRPRRSPATPSPPSLDANVTNFCFFGFPVAKWQLGAPVPLAHCGVTLLQRAPSILNQSNV